MASPESIKAQLPPPEEKYNLVLQANGRWEMYFHFTRLFRGLRDVDTVYRVQEDFTAFCKKVSAACTRGEEVKDYLFLPGATEGGDAGGPGNSMPV